MVIAFIVNHRLGIVVFFLLALAVENALLIKQNREYRAHLADAHAVSEAYSSGAPGRPELIGAEAPQFTLVTLDNAQLSLDDFLGKRLVMVFFASDCPGCQESAPLWEMGARKPGFEDAALIAISRDPIEELKTFASLYDLDFSMCTDPDADTFNAYGIRFVPQAVWIDEEGMVLEFDHPTLYD